MEIVAAAEADAYRAVYTVQFADLIYVLYCFQKKSKKGARTPQHHIEMIRRRLKMAEENHPRRHKEVPIRVTPGSGNICADLNLPNPDEWLAKAELARRLAI